MLNLCQRGVKSNWHMYALIVTVNKCDIYMLSFPLCVLLLLSVRLEGVGWFGNILPEVLWV